MMVGVLAFQGDVREHHEALRVLGAASMDVRSVDDLAKADALIIPGGESTVISKFLSETGLFDAIKTRAKEGFPIYGTCAGAILLASEILHDDCVEPMKLIDITVERNAYGRQAESFSDRISLDLHGEKGDIDAVFIRAPKIVRTGSAVKVLGFLSGEPVLCRQGNILVSTFHPELSGGPSPIHRLFLNAVVGAPQSPPKISGTFV